MPEPNYGGHYTAISHGLECTAHRLYDLVPRLEASGFTDEAMRLRAQLEHFDANTPPPHSTDGMDPKDIRKAYDRSASALVKTQQILYDMVRDKCRFSEHHELLREIHDITQEFVTHTRPKLAVLGLSYFEFRSLGLETEAKLGMGDEVVVEERTERRRRMPKDPDKIEAALRECLATADGLRGKIHNPERERKLDQLIGKVETALETMPRGDDERSRGKRIAALLSATGTLLKVGKWIKKVDLLDTEPSASRRESVIRQFDRLAAVAGGHDLSNDR